jgi:hypothetical protein
MEAISLESMVSKHQEIIASDIDGSTVMMSVENGKYYGLDAIGSCIWSLIREPIRVTDLIDGLLDRFEVDRETCAKDVLVFLEGLNKDGLLKVAGKA